MSSKLEEVWLDIVHQLCTALLNFEGAIGELYLLYDACKQGQSQLVRQFTYQLKERKVKFKLVGANSSTTLHWMCSNGNLTAARLHFGMYGNLEARDENQRTPLHLACQYGHIEIVQHFIQELKCDPEPKDKYGSTPLRRKYAG